MKGREKKEGEPSMYLFPMCSRSFWQAFCTSSSSSNSTNASPLGLPSLEVVMWTPAFPFFTLHSLKNLRISSMVADQGRPRNFTMQPSSWSPPPDILAPNTYAFPVRTEKKHVLWFRRRYLALYAFRSRRSKGNAAEESIDGEENGGRCLTI